MKPSFALSLSHEGIRLFSRAKGGWRLVGETSLDTPDLGETLSYLRDKATRLSGSGLTTKLILPSSQILFTSVTAPGPDVTARTVQIREKLVDSTPYAPDELTFDWRESGDRVNVAAVALETLEEAEAFAVEHRFNPISFVGESQDAHFDGEPFFGATAFSKTLLDDGETVEADAEAFKIIDKQKGKIFSANLDRSILLSPSAQEDPVAEIETPLEEIPSEITDPEVPEDALTRGKERLSQAIETALTTPILPLDNDVEANPQLPLVDDGDAQDAKPTPPPVIDYENPTIPDHLLQAKGTTSLPAKAIEDATPLTAHRGGASHEASFVHRPVVSGTPSAELAARLKVSANKQKKSIKLSESETALEKAGTGIAGAAINIASSLRKKGKGGDKTQTDFTSSRDVDGTKELSEPLVNDEPENVGPLPEPLPPVPTPVVSETAENDENRSIEDRLAGANFTVADPEIPDSEDLGASLGLEALRASEMDFKPEPAAVQDESITVFGANKPAKPVVKSKKTGLILFSGLVAIMALVVLWSMFNDPQKLEGETSSSGTFESFNRELETSLQVVTQTPQDVAPILLDVSPTPPETTEAIQPTLASVDPQSLPEIDAEIQLADQSSDISEPESPKPLTVMQAQEAYDDSGIWQKSANLGTPPEIITNNSLYVPSLDPPLNISDAVALPQALITPDDSPMSPQPSPAPAGSTFALGNDGLVVPSPDGAINPDGILVFSGPPVKRSAARPDTGGVGRSSDPTQPELVARRPIPRPDNLTELREIASLGGRTRDQLARLRPAPRPISEQIAAQTSTDGEALSTTATALAVKTSRTPRTRPSDFASLVKKARVDPVNIEKKATTAKIVAATSTRATSTGPKIPTRASVAKEATQKNKIKMRKVSLIGVYGTPKKRSALVRMGNGKIVEVSIGDRVDGGKVAAIGADQVRYVKGGRNILLKMPPRG